MDDLDGVDGVELAKEVDRGEAPVGAVEADGLPHQSPTTRKSRREARSAASSVSSAMAASRSWCSAFVFP